jgi:hypothetical protein
LVAGPAEGWPRIKMEPALNRAFKDWNLVFPNATCIATLLDRLTHHAEISLIEGKSYRVRESEMESLARKKTDVQQKSQSN